MSLNLADFLYSTEPSNKYAQYINPNSPRIGISNFANTGNVVDPTQTGLPSNPASLATIPSLDEKWIAEGSASHALFVLFGSQPRIVDYVAIAGYRGLIGRQANITLLRSGDVVRSVPSFIFTSENPVFKIFEATECDIVIVSFTSDEDFRMELGYLSVGQTVALPRNMYVDHTPMPYARNVNTRYRNSDNGTFLGQETTSVNQASSVNMSNVPPDYYRDILYPNFQRPAEVQPFFFSWRPKDYPEEVAFCWLPNGRCRVGNEKSNGFMSFGFDMMGHVNEF